jgi:hypothetical protein
MIRHCHLLYAASVAVSATWKSRFWPATPDPFNCPGMETIGSVMDASPESVVLSDFMKGESMLYVAKHDIMVMRRRRKGESLPPPLPPKLLRAGFMAKGAAFRQREGEEQRREEGKGGEKKEIWFDK